MARISGKKKSHAILGSESEGRMPLPPTSHPMTPPKEKGGMLTWGKKDGPRAEKWENGVIGKERARVIIDGSSGGKWRQQKSY